MKNTLISEIAQMRKIMGLKESTNPDVNNEEESVVDESLAPARPDVEPDTITTPKTTPGRPEPRHPLRPNPVVKPAPKATMEEDSMPEFMLSKNLLSGQHTKISEDAASCGCPDRE